MDLRAIAEVFLRLVYVVVRVRALVRARGVESVL
jgi:hypothetical protein